MRLINFLPSLPLLLSEAPPLTFSPPLPLPPPLIISQEDVKAFSHSDFLGNLHRGVIMLFKGGGGNTKEVKEKEEEKEGEGQCEAVEEEGGASLPWGWPLFSWADSCEAFRMHPQLSGGRVERLYGELDGQFTNLNASKADFFSAEHSGPLYWAVKELPSTDPISFFLASQITDLPFLPPPLLSDFKRTMEFWFSREGGGAKPHADSHLQATMVVQVAGSRRWRLGPLPLPSRPTLIAPFGDFKVETYSEEEEGWGAEKGLSHVLQVEKGDILVFPPGVLHETKNTGSSCSLSLTTQLVGGGELGSPFFFAFNRLEEFRKTADLREFWPEFLDIASLGGLTLGFDPASPLPFQGCGGELKRGRMEGCGKKLWEEAVAKWVQPLCPQSPEGECEGDEKEGGEEDKSISIRDIDFRYWVHDEDRDESISWPEFFRTFKRWIEVEAKVLLSTPKAIRLAHYYLTDQLVRDVLEFESS